MTSREQPANNSQAQTGSRHTDPYADQRRTADPPIQQDCDLRRAQAGVIKEMLTDPLFYAFAGGLIVTIIAIALRKA